MYKKVFLLAMIVIASNNIKGQFNTVRQPDRAKVIEPVKKEEEKKDIPVQEKGDEKPKSTMPSVSKNAYWNQRRYVSLPIDSLIITSDFGQRKDPFNGKTAEHKGIDIDADNNYVYSVMPGKVTKAGKSKGLGNYVEVNHGDYITIYGHMRSLLVSEKQMVEAGQPIGISGSTGRSTGEHLHFAVKYKGELIDPMPLLVYIYDIITNVKREMNEQIAADGAQNQIK